MFGDDSPLSSLPRARVARHLAAMWRRPLWMRLAALSGGGSMLALIFGDELVRAAAQVQFIHAMATFACATVMNIGGLQARWAPGFFLPGSLAYAGAGYALASGAPPWIEGLRWAGVAVLAAGWILLAWAAGRADRAARLVVASDAPDARRTRVVAKRLRAI